MILISLFILMGFGFLENGKAKTMELKLSKIEEVKKILKNGKIVEINLAVHCPAYISPEFYKITYDYQNKRGEKIYSGLTVEGQAKSYVVSKPIKGKLSKTEFSEIVYFIKSDISWFKERPPKSVRPSSFSSLYDLTIHSKETGKKPEGIDVIRVESWYFGATGMSEGLNNILMRFEDLFGTNIVHVPKYD